MKNLLVTLLFIPFGITASESGFGSQASSASTSSQSPKRRTLGNFCTVSFTKYPARPHDLDSALTVDPSGEEVEGGLAVPFDNSDNRFMTITTGADGNPEICNVDEDPSLTVEQVKAAKDPNNLKALPEQGSLTDAAFRSAATATARLLTSEPAQQIAGVAVHTVNAAQEALAQGTHHVGLRFVGLTHQLRQSFSPASPAQTDPAIQAEATELD